MGDFVLVHGAGYGCGGGGEVVAVLELVGPAGWWVIDNQWVFFIIILLIFFVFLAGYNAIALLSTL